MGSRRHVSYAKDTEEVGFGMALGDLSSTIADYILNDTQLRICFKGLIANFVYDGELLTRHVLLRSDWVGTISIIFGS
uniref:Uncharacterized protein n=1 Tax=Caenorhabditis japonica TaxID=281687 RepID=A0A8R1IJ25_CAEJA